MRAPSSLSIISVLLLTVAIFCAVPALTRGEEGNLDINGFLLGNFTGRTTGKAPPDGEGNRALLAEERLRLEVGTWVDSIEASALIKADLFHDAVIDEFDIDLREAYIDYTTEALDIRLGRQIATWGTGNLLFINDVFPKDWVSFFSGRPLEYLKIGVDALRTRYSSDVFDADLLVIPFFEPDNVTTSKRFFLFDPFANVGSRDELRPEERFVNTELALRVYRNIRGFDASVYAYRGFWRVKGAEPDSFASPTRVTYFYPELSVYGFSIQGGVLGGVLSLESGYYHSRNDEDGGDPTVPNSEVRLLTGYQRQIRKDLTVGVQYYLEVMEDYSTYKENLPAILSQKSRYRDTVTVRLEQLLRHQTWRLSLFVFYGPAESDYLFRPLTSYKFSDNLSATLGANIFGGDKDTTSLGQFDRNDNVYLSVRFDF
jgi:hypothetical protein